VGVPLLGGPPWTPQKGGDPPKKGGGGGDPMGGPKTVKNVKNDVLGQKWVFATFAAPGPPKRPKQPKPAKPGLDP